MSSWIKRSQFFSVGKTKITIYLLKMKETLEDLLICFPRKLWQRMPKRGSKYFTVPDDITFKLWKIFTHRMHVPLSDPGYVSSTQLQRIKRRQAFTPFSGHSPHYFNDFSLHFSLRPRSALKQRLVAHWRYQELVRAGWEEQSQRSKEQKRTNNLQEMAAGCWAVLAVRSSCGWWRNSKMAAGLAPAPLCLWVGLSTRAAMRSDFSKAEFSLESC